MTTEFLPCVKRQVQTSLAKDGTKGTIYRCAHQQASRFARDVTPFDCAVCPLRAGTHYRPPDLVDDKPALDRQFGEPQIAEDGSIRYERKGIEPPPPHAGYHRKSDDITSPDAWVFVPTYQPCQHREMVNAVRPCGCLKMNAICVSRDSGFEGQVVNPAICVKCPVRHGPGMVDNLVAIG